MGNRLQINYDLIWNIDIELYNMYDTKLIISKRKFDQFPRKTKLNEIRNFDAQSNI